MTERPIRDCQHTTVHHEHGTTAGYWSDRCRCDRCGEASRLHKRARYRAIAYGTHRPALVPVVGTRRRIQALATLGYSAQSLSQMMGMNKCRLNDIMKKTVGGISLANHDLIAALYDELSDTPAPRTNLAERVSASKAVATATSNGYLPPIAWDDDTIDDPHAVPFAAEPVTVDEVAVELACTGRRVALTRAELDAAILAMHSRGVSDLEIGRRLNMLPGSVWNTRDRAQARADRAGQDVAA